MHIIIYFDLQAIRHQKLNRPDNPCENSPDYNLGHCVEKSVMRKTGCQPPWRKINVFGLPLCDNFTLLAKYGSEFERVGRMVREDVVENTKCLMPCSFMEYEVSM